MLMERSEFLTPYTPYQPEISQGGLQVMFEYQTAISELTALPVSNASVYEGPSRGRRGRLSGEAAQRGRRFVVSAGMHPHSIADAAHATPTATAWRSSRCPARRRRHRSRRVGAGDRRRHQRGDLRPAELLRRGRGRSGAERAAGQVGGAGRAGRDRPGRPDHARHPRAARRVRGRRGRRRGPAARQPARLRRALFGFFAAREEYLRRMPGRIAGETVDVTAAAGSCSRCRPASSTSAARRPPRTSAPPRR